MKEATKGLLEKNVEDYIKRIKEVDIVIGIPSFNNSSTIEKVISNYGKGLEKYYSDFKCLIINSDGGSTDGTREKALAVKVPSGVEKVVTTYRGTPGKGSALRTIFETARLLDAKACIISDADTRSIKPQWAYRLIEPVLRMGYGYVTPYYKRDKHDATITNALVYPLTRALYNLRIRQPIGGDFAFSNGALQIFSRGNYWKRYPYIVKFGVDIWMTTIAINEGFRIAQTALGAKIHDEKDPGKDLSPMFKQVIGTIFDLIGGYEYKWKIQRESKPVPIIGKYEFIEAEKINVNFDDLLEKFLSGLAKYKDVWKYLFEDNTYSEFNKKVATSKKEDLNISIELWSKVVYEFACAYNFASEDDKDFILDAMIPLYYIRTASFIREAEHFSNEIADAVVEAGAGVFERMSKYLVMRWDNYSSKDMTNIRDKVIKV